MQLGGRLRRANGVGSHAFGRAPRSALEVRLDFRTRVDLEGIVMEGLEHGFVPVHELGSQHGPPVPPVSAHESNLQESSIRPEVGLHMLRQLVPQLHPRHRIALEVLSVGGEHPIIPFYDLHAARGRPVHEVIHSLWDRSQGRIHHHALFRDSGDIDGSAIRADGSLKPRRGPTRAPSLLVIPELVRSRPHACEEPSPREPIHALDSEGTIPEVVIEGQGKGPRSETDEEELDPEPVASGQRVPPEFGEFSILPRDERDFHFHHQRPPKAGFLSPSTYLAYCASKSSISCAALSLRFLASSMSHSACSMSFSASSFIRVALRV